MKSFKEKLAEVAQPISPDEKRFKDQHTVLKFDYPVKDSDNMFKGNTTQSPGHPPDQRDSTNYDKAYASRKAPTSNIGEETETLEEGTDLYDKGGITITRFGMGGGALGLQVSVGRNYIQMKPADVNNMIAGLKMAQKNLRKGMKEETVLENKKADLMKKLAKVSASSEKGKKAVTLKKAPWEKKEEAVQIDEISKKLAGRYIKKAQIDTADAADKVARSYDAYDKKQGEKQRKAGIARVVRRRMGTSDAVSKLTGTARVPAKEATVIDEAVKVGNMRLSDGSTVKITKEDAQLMNQMFKDLNAKNRKTMESVMKKDKAGFKEILGFAREAL